LNKEDSSLLSGDVFPQTKKDWEAALNSVYEPLAGRSGGLFHGMLMGAMTTFPELATDVMDCYWNWDRFDKHQYNNSNMLWASENLDPFGQYKFITRAQAFVGRIKSADGISDEVKNEMIAEAKTAQAYMMFRLYSVFGPVPVIPADKVLDTTDMTFYPRSSDAEYIGMIQKLIEEAPAPGLSPELRQAMGEAAVRAAEAVGYEGAGTVEFLVDGENFYFMEMNTRIQVEHGVTELVTGVDLVRQQLRIASGLPLDMGQEDVTIRGCAMECRVNAEDPHGDFRPCPGKVEFLHFPGGAGVRVDSCLYNGCTMSPYYDSLAAKVLAHGATRLEAVRKLRRCLEEFTLEGFPTNAELSYEILFHPVFVRGRCTTGFLDAHLAELLDFSRRVREREAEET